MSDQNSDTNTNTATAPAATDIVEVTDINLFVAVVSKWHAKAVATLEHMKTIPDGSRVSVDDGADMVLTGDVKAAFSLGITLSLMELGTLPFFSEISEEAGTTSAEIPG